MAISASQVRFACSVLPTCVRDALARIDHRKSRVVELRYFVGLNVEEAAEVLGVSVDTVKRDWRMARAWLLAELAGEHDSPGS